MKIVLTALVSATAGFVAGAGAMLIAFPFLFPPPPANDPLPASIFLQQAAPIVKASSAAGPANRLTQGRFSSESPGRDALHWADGQVGIYRSGDRAVLRLEGDFAAGPGPSLVIYLNTKAVGDEADFLGDVDRRQVAALRSFKGAQNYVLPAGIDLTRFQSVTIWCERFSQFIGNAELPKGLGLTPGA